jgi:steroid delta-isomerase-like uncharacterized protein
MGDARDLVQHTTTAWNDHDRTAWTSTFSADAVLTAPGLSGSGPDTVDLFYALWQDAFPDNQVRTVAIFEDGSTGVLQAVFEGTHTATLNVPGQPIAATGKRVSIPFVDVSTVDEGKIASFTLYFDRAELMAQLGLVPATAS